MIQAGSHLNLKGKSETMAISNSKLTKLKTETHAHAFQKKEEN
jgi:hypothetical protein